MARETADYRDELEEILRFSGGRHSLTITDVANYLGRSRKWVRENKQIQKATTPAGISAVSLAKVLQAAK